MRPSRKRHPSLVDLDKAIASLEHTQKRVSDTFKIAKCEECTDSKKCDPCSKKYAARH
jgi:hypothetical protein